MKITKRGKTINEKIWVGSCRVCKSEAEATENEMTNITENDYRNEGRFSWEKCPVCEAGKNGYGGMLFHPKDK